MSWVLFYDISGLNLFVNKNGAVFKKETRFFPQVSFFKSIFSLLYLPIEQKQ